MNLQREQVTIITVSLIRNGAITDRNTVLHHTLNLVHYLSHPTLFNLLISFSLSLEPTAPPSGVTVTGVTSTSITVQWGWYHVFIRMETSLDTLSDME